MTTPTSEDTAAAKSPAPTGSDQPGKKGGFFAATYEELKLVVWPSRQQLFSESIAVILMVSLSAAAIAALSRFYGWAASQVFR
ncbi:MAG: preprotein translocase subunit SecE [Synechococcus sp.]|uniref:preprotein translocase subunit SecE n=1 Tax=unclassified Synechococcus TaxID=2626047 RepID=UPI00015257BC|nr:MULTISPECIES: preprotein translocase subunit SecE [unclassified Synechococcus]MBL6797628.1 preprotein translocase subunit SecE [Synechococcus sp. BS307-5m-G39]PTT98526.1 preprotein translocase subunit SecE [Pseudomonas sp. HMWF031]CAK24802.1 Preprotein translocase SecE subunit [Synechococcus sp. WH 7803]MCT0250963.1 preprotein translocase subunit SecE [Synechococcus sp. CS-197]QNI68983.1 Preprotein translocase SecE subunit [Synechococcus sp. BMK-MC-1]